MIQQTTKSKKVLATVLIIVMLAAMMLPTTALAAISEVTATGTVTEQTGGGYEKTITVLFDEEVAIDPAAVLDTDIQVSSKTFGTGASFALAEDKKTLVFTLGADSDIAVGDAIEFSNDKVSEEANSSVYFNNSVVIGGALEPASIQYTIDPSDATLEVAGYATNPTEVGVGTFSYTVSKDNYVTKTDSFEITEADLGSPIEVSVTLEKNSADYTVLNAKILEAGNYDANDYTPESYPGLTSALSDAQAVATDLKFDEQTQINDAVSTIEAAIAALVPWTDVSFSAVAIADDATVNYAKATKVVLVFGEPLTATADVLSQLSIKDSVQSAAWKDAACTVYELVLKANADLSNGTVVEFTRNDSVQTATGKVLKDAQATVLGNLEEAYEAVTASSAAGTIVKSGAKPGVVAGDKIVLTFDAPVYGNPAEISVKTDEDEVFTATAVAGTSNTIYEITLTDGANVKDTSVLSVPSLSISGITLTGSFGAPVAPVAKTAYAVDNDGQVTTTGDQIVIVFDRATNGAAINLPSVPLGGAANLNFGNNSTYAWEMNNTRLVITLGDTAAVKDNMTINLSGCGIRDEYELVDAVGLGSINVAGRFGMSLQPRIVRAIAFTQGGQHMVRVYFNTTVKWNDEQPVVKIYNSDATEFADDGAQIQWSKTGDNAISYCDITLGSNHGEFSNETVKIEGTLVDDLTGKMELTDASTLVIGGFEKGITPEILSLTLYSKEGKGILGNGDKLVLVTNKEVASVTNTSLSPFTSGDNITWVYEVQGSEDITIGKELTFEISSDGKVTSDKATVKGSMGNKVTPELLSATAYSCTGGSGVAQKGDIISLVFNTAVTDVSVTGFGAATQSDGGVTWTITLGENTSVQTGNSLSISFRSLTTGESFFVNQPLAGSFGWIVEPKIISATRLSKNGFGYAEAGDTLVVVYNTKVTIDSVSDYVFKYETVNDKEYPIGEIYTQEVTSTSSGKKYNLSATIVGTYGSCKAVSVKSVVLRENSAGKEVITVTFDGKTTQNVIDLSKLISNNSHLGGSVTPATWEEDGQVLSILLNADATTKSGDVLDLSGLDIKDDVTKRAIDNAELKSLPITGTLIPMVVGNPVVDGNVITVTFSTRTNQSEATLNAIKAQTERYGSGVQAAWSENGHVLTITMSDDNNLPLNASLVLNGLGIKDGFSETYEVTGQYQMDTTNLTRRVLGSVAYVSTDITEREDYVNAVQGDKVIVKFAAITDADISSSAAAYVAPVGEDETFGEGYSAVWVREETNGQFDSIEITLGANPKLSASSQIEVKNVKFANGTGKLSAENADSVILTLTGQFDGNPFLIEDDQQALNIVNGRVRVTAKVSKADVRKKFEGDAYIVAQAQSSKGAVLSINAVKLTDAAQTEAVFDFKADNVANVKLIVLGGDYADAEQVVSVLSAEVTKTKQQDL